LAVVSLLRPKASKKVRDPRTRQKNNKNEKEVVFWCFHKHGRNTTVLRSLEEQKSSIHPTLLIEWFKHYL
jgi:hypothetical protein